MLIMLPTSVFLLSWKFGQLGQIGQFGQIGHTRRPLTSLSDSSSPIESIAVNQQEVKQRARSNALKCSSLIVNLIALTIEKIRTHRTYRTYRTNQTARTREGSSAVFLKCDNKSQDKNFSRSLSDEKGNVDYAPNLCVSAFLEIRTARTIRTIRTNQTHIGRHEKSFKAKLSN